MAEFYCAWYIAQKLKHIIVWVNVRWYILCACAYCLFIWNMGFKTVDVWDSLDVWLGLVSIAASQAVDPGFDSTLNAYVLWPATQNITSIPTKDTDWFKIWAWRSAVIHGLIKGVNYKSKLVTGAELVTLNGYILYRLLTECVVYIYQIKWSSWMDDWARFWQHVVSIQETYDAFIIMKKHWKPPAC